MVDNNHFADEYRNQLHREKSYTYENLEYTRNDFALTDPTDQTLQRDQLSDENTQVCKKNQELNTEIREASLDLKDIDENQNGIKEELDQQDKLSSKLEDLYGRLFESFRTLQTQLNQLNDHPQQILHYLKPYQLSDPPVKNLIKTLPNGEEILTNYQEWQRIVGEYQQLMEQYDGTNYQIDEYENQIDEIFLNNMVIISPTQPKPTKKEITKAIPVAPPKKLSPKLPPQGEVKLPPLPKKLPPKLPPQKELPSILQKLPPPPKKPVPKFEELGLQPPPKKPVPVPGEKKTLKKKQLVKKP